MSPHEHDDLSRLFSDTVDDLEPAHGLGAIRAHTAIKESPMTNARTWLLGALGAAVATAAVITAVVVVGNTSSTRGEDPGPAGSPSQSVTDGASETPSTTPPDTASPPPSSPQPTQTRPAPPPAGATVPVYYLGDTPFGPRLYREFQPATSSDRLTDSVAAAVAGDPLDPDYRSGWPNGTSFASASYDGDLITVDLNGDLHDRPDGMTVAEADMAIEQLIFTAQAAVQKGRVPVQLLLGGSRTDQVLGQPASEPLANGPVLETLSLVSLTTPGEGSTYSTGGRIELTGVANSFEANVGVRLQRVGGTEVIDTYATADGWMDEKLFPFTGEVSLAGVPPGRYLLIASTDDPSGEGRFYTDTRTILVE